MNPDRLRHASKAEKRAFKWVKRNEATRSIDKTLRVASVMVYRSVLPPHRFKESIHDHTDVLGIVDRFEEAFAPDFIGIVLIGKKEGRRIAAKANHDPQVISMIRKAFYGLPITVHGKLGGIGISGASPEGDGIREIGLRAMPRTHSALLRERNMIARSLGQTFESKAIQLPLAMTANQEVAVSIVDELRNLNKSPMPVELGPPQLTVTYSNGGMNMMPLNIEAEDLSQVIRPEMAA